MRQLPPLLDNSCYDASIYIQVVRLDIAPNNIEKLYGVSWKWWGESSTCISRPPHDCNEYFIASGVFEKYLELCEVLEFIVFDLESGDIIGGAFLHNARLIVEKPTFQIEVINHAGIPIGIISIHFDVSKYRRVTLLETKPFVKTTVSVRSRIDSQKQSFRLNSVTTNKIPKYGITASLEKKCVVRFPYKGPKRKPVENIFDIPKLESSSIQSLKALSGCMGTKEKGKEKPCCDGLERLDFGATENGIIKKDWPHSQERFEMALCTKIGKDVKVTSNLQTLMDFLVGENLTEQEERLAVSLIQRISPNHKFVNLITENCEKLSSRQTIQCDLKGLIKRALNVRENPMDRRVHWSDTATVNALLISPRLPKKYSYNLQDPFEKAYFSKFILRERL